MTGEFASMRKLPPELHEAATKLVAEVMASIAMRALTEPQSIMAILHASDKQAPLPEAFRSEASDFLDIRGDLVEWALPKS